MCKSHDVDASTADPCSSSSEVAVSESEQNVELDFTEDFVADLFNAPDMVGYPSQFWWPDETADPLFDPYWSAMAWDPMWNVPDPSMMLPYFSMGAPQRRKKNDSTRKPAKATLPAPINAPGLTLPDGAGGDGTEETRTTLMIRNLPNDYSRDMLLKLLDDQGFREKYNFAYLPIDFTRWAGVGYAFVNFVSGPEADRARHHFHGFSSWEVGSHKVCEVTWSDPVQGFEENVQRYRNSPVMHGLVPDDVKPVVYTDGVRVAFPEPTKKIRLPRFKKGPKCGILPVQFAQPMDVDLCTPEGFEEDDVLVD